jgi:hypothetical protein
MHPKSGIPEITGNPDLGGHTMNILTSITSSTFVRNTGHITAFLAEVGVTDIPLSAGVALITDIQTLWCEINPFVRSTWFDDNIRLFVSTYVKWVTAGELVICLDSGDAAELTRRLTNLGNTLHKTPRSADNRRALLAYVGEPAPWECATLPTP